MIFRKERDIVPVPKPPVNRKSVIPFYDEIPIFFPVHQSTEESIFQPLSRKETPRSYKYR